jgi:hypothetical protein
MNVHEQERIERLLKAALPSSGSGTGAELRRDLWPTMMKRLAARPKEIPWFDWVLIAAMAAWLLLFPGTIPVLVYHL